MLKVTNLTDLNFRHIIISKELVLLRGLCPQPFTLRPIPKEVEDIGVEPMTLCVQGRCSSQLS